MGAVYAPLGGGRIGKVEAFNILSDSLQLEERPISAIRLDLFRLVFLLGQHISYESKHGSNTLELWDENWDMLNGLYEGLAAIEGRVMKETHEANLKQFLSSRSVDQFEEDALEEFKRRTAASA